MIEKKYIVRHCSNYEGNPRHWYEAHYSNGNWSQLYSTENYRNFLKFTDLLNEGGYKYIENEDEY